MITLISVNDDGTLTIQIHNEPEQLTLTDEEFDKLLKECLTEEYPDMVKDPYEILTSRY